MQDSLFNNPRLNHGRNPFAHFLSIIGHLNRVEDEQDHLFGVSAANSTSPLVRMIPLPYVCAPFTSTYSVSFFRPHLR